MKEEAAATPAERHLTQKEAMKKKQLTMLTHLLMGEKILLHTTATFC